MKEETRASMLFYLIAGIWILAMIDILLIAIIFLRTRI